MLSIPNGFFLRAVHQKCSTVFRVHCLQQVICVLFWSHSGMWPLCQAKTYILPFGLRAPSKWVSKKTKMPNEKWDINSNSYKICEKLFVVVAVLLCLTRNWRCCSQSNDSCRLQNQSKLTSTPQSAVDRDVHLQSDVTCKEKKKKLTDASVSWTAVWTTTHNNCVANKMHARCSN